MAATKEAIRVVVIDHPKFCLDLTVEALRREGWEEVISVHVTDENRDRFNINPGEVETLRWDYPLNDLLKVAVDSKRVNCLDAIGCAGLLVCDLELGGGVNSWGFLLTVRKRFPNLPIVLLTDVCVQCEALRFIGIHIVGKSDFYGTIPDIAGNRTLRTINTAQCITGSKSLVQFAYGALDQARKIIPADDPAWVSSENEDGSGLNRIYINATDPRLDTLLPPLWSDLVVPNAFQEVVDMAQAWTSTDHF